MSAPHSPTPRAAAWQQVVGVTWSRTRNLGQLRWWGAIGGIVAIGALVLISAMPRVHLGRFAALLSAGLLGAGLLSLAWTAWVNSLLAQNQPALARLVPGHLRTLRRSFLVTGTVACLAATALGAAFGHALAAGAGTALALLVLAWLAHAPALGLVGWLAFVAHEKWPGDWTGRDAFEAFGDAQPVAVGVAVAALLMAAAVGSAHALLRGGDPWHRRTYQRRALRLQALRTGRTDRTRWPEGAGPFGRLKRASVAPYRWLLARACARRSGSVLGRGLLGLGPQCHWSGQLGAVLVYGAVGILLVMLAWSLFVRPAPPGFGVFFPIATGLGSYLISNSLAARAVFHTTRREQALLMLLPGMPRGQVLNRGLAIRLMGQFAATWAVGVLACTALVLRDRDSAVWLGLFGTASLPCAALLLRDWSRLPAPSPSSGALPMAGIMVLAVPVAIFHNATHLAVWPFELAIALATLGLLVWRWRVAMRAPAAFPAGRR